ncbi:MAG: hypothetical protein K0S39_1718 [Paenibacillus sp.]|jgi:hypothetical protein|nr:hypothetical protein [Paenibacillus sp.]
MNSGHEDAMCERLELYALDGLEEHEKVAFKYHLTQCALCRNQLIELKLVVDLLPLASEPVPLPAGMRDRVLGSVLGNAAAAGQSGNEQAERYAEAESDNAGLVLQSRKANQSGGSGSEAVKAVGLSRRAVHTERSGRKAVFWRWISAGLSAAVIGTGLYAFQLRDTIGELRAELAAADKELAKINTDLASLHKPAEAAKVNRIVSLSPAVENVVSKGLATIVIDAKGAHLIVQAEDLPQIKQDEAFQVWLIKDNQPINAGTFYPHNGKGAIYFTFEPKEYDTVAITLEPDAHGEKPRGAIVLAAGLKS